MPYKDPNRNKELKRERYRNDPEYREMILAKNRARKEQRKEYYEENNRKAREKYARNKAAMVDRLGGKCVGCGVTTNLEFDHIDRSKKANNLTKLLKGPIDKLTVEVDKCQLLCKTCHTIKSRVCYDHQELLKGYSLQNISEDTNTITIIYKKDC